MTKVALVKTADRAAGVRKSLQILGVNPVKDRGVVLKPNFNTAHPAPGSTHNDTLHSLVAWLKDSGARQITVAERSGPTNTRACMEEKGIFRMAEELGFGIVNLEEIDRDEWIHVRPADSHWPDGFLFPRIYHGAECIVETCCLKTHQFGGHFSLSLKLAVGTVSKAPFPSEGTYTERPGMRGHMRQMHGSPYQRHMIAEINTAFSPALIVLDGVDAFTHGGPQEGIRVQANVMLAGTDRIAIDAVGVAILRHLGTTQQVSDGPIFQQDQIARAAELGLGVDSPHKIEVVTGDEDSEEYAVTIRGLLAQG